MDLQSATQQAGLSLEQVLAILQEVGATAQVVAAASQRLVELAGQGLMQQPETMQSATESLHRDAQAQAAQRAGGY
jgi:hypothetical protein